MRLIDSDALDDKLEALVQKYTAKGRPEVAKDYSFVQTVLLTAPTVDAVEVVHGKWDEGVCTHCSFDIRCLTDGESDLEQWVWDEGFDYCPNCGAKMDGGNEDVQISC